MYTLFGPLFVKRFALSYRTIVCLSCPVCLSVTLVYCGQTVGWIKMKLGMRVGLGHAATLYKMGIQLPPRKGYSSPPFEIYGRRLCLHPLIHGPCLLWPNGWMDHDATWYGGRPQPSPHCVRWGPSSHSPKGCSLPNFRPISVVAKWLDRLRVPLGMEVGICVIWEPSSRSPKRGGAHIHCGRTPG